MRTSWTWAICLSATVVFAFAVYANWPRQAIAGGVDVLTNDHEPRANLSGAHVPAPDSGKSDEDGSRETTPARKELPPSPKDGTWTRQYKQWLERLNRGEPMKFMTTPPLIDPENDKSYNPKGYKLTPQEKASLNALLQKQHRKYIEAAEAESLTRLKILADKEARKDFRFYSHADYTRNMSAEVSKEKRRGDNEYAMERTKAGVRLFTFEYHLFPEVHESSMAKLRAHHEIQHKALEFFQNLRR